MTASSKPPIKRQLYNQVMPGVYGELGAGAGTQVFFLQTAIRPADLQKTTLISDIAGSERWPVRDLFQREVDVRRVTHSLLPYLQDMEKVKFFNPLTLTILPMDTGRDEVLVEMPDIKKSVLREDDDQWEVFELDGFYRFRHMSDNPEYGRIEWNDTKTKLVAIDGQHRLSALKRFLSDNKPGAARTDFLTWHIPVVIVSFRCTDDRADRRSILEVVRSIFIYINREAKSPNRARQILLTDESVNAICTQELVQISHANDLRDARERVESTVPLLFYDWRGEEDEGRRMPAPASLKPIEEISDWFSSYILDDDFELKQEAALDIQPIEPLKGAFQKKKLTPSMAEELRRVVRERLLPGITFLLENFEPYKKYISHLRALEQEYNAKSDVARHAFYQLRFGTNRAGEDLQKAIQELHDELVERITHEVQPKALHPPIDLDIGMRGIVSAFGELRDYRARSLGKSVSWRDYAEWFTKGLNQAYADGWLDSRDGAKKRGHLLHIVEDHNGTVVNYRLDAANDALGALVALLVAAYGRAREGGAEDAWIELHENLVDRLSATILRGHKKEARVQLRLQFPAGGKPLTDAVRSEADSRTSKQLKRLDQAVSAIKS